MPIAALVTWLLTAGGGFIMLGGWISHGGLSQQRSGTSRFPAPVIFGHFGLAAAGLVLWIAFVALHTKALGWIAFGALLPVAVLGFVMLLRWLPGWQASRRAGPATVPATAGGGGARYGTAGGRAVDGGAVDGGAEQAAETHLPVPVIVAHGLLAVVTLVLVLLAVAGGN
jgi:hypothetical protein